MSLEKITFEVQETPFVMVHRPLIQNKGLSAKAKFMLIWLLDKPDNWDCTIEGMKPFFLEKEAAIVSGISELTKAGYLEIIRKKDEKNKYIGTHWIVRYIPKKCPHNECGPQPENQGMAHNEYGPQPDFPRCGKSRTSNTQDSSLHSESINKKKENKTKKDGAIAPVSPQAAQLFDFLFEELKKLDPGKNKPSGVSAKPWIDVFTKLLVGRNIEGIKKIITYALLHPFYSTRITKPKNLLYSFSDIVLSESSSKKINPKSSVDHKKYVEEFCESRKQKLSNMCVNIEALNKHVEIVVGSGNYQPIVIQYDKNAFIERFQNELRKIGIV
jgi:hypothetical protein